MTPKTKTPQKEEKKEVRVDLIEPTHQWEMWLKDCVKETGYENCGLFCNAKTEKEAIKIFDNIIKLIRERGIKIDEN